MNLMRVSRYLPSIMLILSLLLPHTVVWASESTVNSTIAILDNNYNVVWIKSGDGSPSNPYVIEDLTISLENAPAIIIENSNKFLLIRNITITVSSVKAAIELRNVSNVVFENITINGAYTDYGIMLDNVLGTSFKNIKISGTLAPIKFENVHDLNNVFENISFYGKSVLFLVRESNVTISGSYAQIMIYNASSIVIENASVASSGVEYINFGIFAYNVENLVIRNSGIKASRGITVLLSKNIAIEGNTLVFTNYGLHLGNSSLIMISRNSYLPSMRSVAITLDGAKHATVSDVSLLRAGISVSNSESVSLINITIEEGSLYVSNSYEVIARDITLENNKDTVLTVEYSNDVSFENLRIKSVRFTYGIDVEKEERVNAFVIRSSSDIKISNSIINDVYTGVLIIGGFKISFIRTSIVDAVIGIEGYYVNNATFQEAYFNKIDSVGLRLRYSTEIIVEKSRFEDIDITAINFLSVSTALVRYSVFKNVGAYVVEDSNHEYIHNFWDKYEGQDNNGDGYGDEEFQVSMFSVDPAPAMEENITSILLPELNKNEEKGLSEETKTLIGIIVVIVLVVIINVVYFLRYRKEEF